MVTYVLDTSALLRFLDREAGFERVREILKSARDNRAQVTISSVNWGELVSTMAKRHGIPKAEEISDSLDATPLQIIDVDTKRAKRTGLLKHQFGIPYADCFGVELASDSPEHILVTADFDAKPAEQSIQIEFLPTKPKP